MKIKHQLSIATLLMAGVFVTGCSSSQSQAEGASQVSGSQQQVEGAAPVVAEPIAAPAPAVKMAPKPVKRMAPKRMAPKPRGNRWTHTHPAVPRCTKSVRHTHKYNQARHSHKYSCQGQRMAPKRMAPKPQVDVRALQMKLRAKGYYKGPIDGIVGPGTRSALQRFMKR